MHALDLLIDQYIAGIRTPGLTEYMYLVSVLFDVTLASVIVSCLTAFLIYLFRGARCAILFLATVIAGAGIALATKELFNVARPTVGAVYIVIGPSFPSYHAVMATMYFGILMYLFDDYFGSVGRIAFNTLCICGMLLVAISRIYLGVHWLSDILGGIVLGAIVAHISILVFRWYDLDFSFTK